MDIFKKNEKIIKWKSIPISQLTSKIVLNGVSNPIINIRLLFKPLPLKIYRREIGNPQIKWCGSRASQKIDQLDMPGGAKTSKNTNTGIQCFTDINYENNRCQHPTTNNCLEFLSTSGNAKRRVRSSGMTKPRYNISSNRNVYYSSSHQYLTSRNRTYESTQYFHVRQGDATAKPGTLLASANIYTSNNSSDCGKYFFNVNVSNLSYIWLDGGSYTIPIPSGYYNIDDFNTIIKNTMITNKHYLLITSTQTKVFLLNLGFNSTTNRIQIQSKIANTTIFPSITFSLPVGVSWSLSSTSRIVSLVIPLSSTINNAFGFSQGTYPIQQLYSQDQIVEGNFFPGLKSAFVPLYYKPNNSKFAKQGAVSSSDLIARKKYDTITTSASSVRTAYGNSTANALAYGATNETYTLKDRIGFPILLAPKFNVYTNKLQKCMILRTSRNLLNG
jgi:hypothetical protein